MYVCIYIHQSKISTTTTIALNLKYKRYGTKNPFLIITD